MKKILKLEEFAMFAGSILLLYVSNAEWWWYPLLLLGPDISMLGYLAGNKTGAFCYNLFHHKAIAVIIFALGVWILKIDWLMLLGIVLFGHSSMDRFFGYGLKYKSGFKFTHLGEIGKRPL
jgi:Domain of unknown function (DUF4260)